MLPVNDPVFIAGWQAIERVKAAGVSISSTGPLEQYTPLGSAFWNLFNWLSVARGDAIVQGTPVSQTTRDTILDSITGEIKPGNRTSIAQWTAQVNAAYPAVAVPTPTPTPQPQLPADAPFLGGILDGELFGVPKKLLIVGAIAAYFLTTKD